MADNMPGNPVAPALERAAADMRKTAPRSENEGVFLLAVAGLLEAQARNARVAMTWHLGADCAHEWPAGRRELRGWHCSDCAGAWGVPGGCGCWAAALAVARAWLGETETVALADAAEAWHPDPADVEALARLIESGREEAKAHPHGGVMVYADTLARHLLRSGVTLPGKDGGRG